MKIHGDKIDSEYIVTRCSKLISLIDLAGHEKYFKTTAFGMLANKSEGLELTYSIRPTVKILRIGRPSRNPDFKF